MIKFLRRIYSGQKLFRRVEFDRLLQMLYARWLSFRKTGPIFSVFAEISSKCNLACANCYRTDYDYSGKNLNMSLSTFKEIVDQVPSGIQYLVTQGIGESASNPDLKEMLQYASDSGKFKTIILDSNLLLKDLPFYQSLFSHGLGRLIVSVDSFDQEICDQLRAGTDIQELTQRLRVISKNNPDRVHVRVTVSKINLHDLENTLDKLIALEISRMEIGPLIDYHNKGNALDQQGEDKLLSVIKKYEKKIDILLSMQHICTLPFTVIGVNARGNIMPCCIEFDDDIFHFGNICLGLENSYYSEAFNNIRSTFYKEMPAFCEGCPYYSKLAVSPFQLRTTC
jgi:MoaA/NifB/PqqE/SkfB family radical SAM enzyme